MRIFTKAAIVAGALATGVALAAPAEAATHSWSVGGVKNVSAYGTYSKDRIVVSVNGTLVHSKSDGYSPCILVTYTQGSSHQQKGACLYKGKQLYTGKVSWRFKDASDLEQHLYIQVGHIKPGWKSVAWAKAKRVY
jgi:hypothetical protein